MPPSSYESVPACGSRRASSFADLGLATTSSTLANSDERERCESLQFSLFAVYIFGIFICCLFGFVMWKLASKSEFGWARRFARCCSSKARNAFTKMKSFARRRETIPDDIGDAAAVATKTLTTIHVRKAASESSDVELDVMALSCGVPFTECTNEGTCETDCK
ncbi:hypothetical protein THARTR1_07558 [Trichoderma harzianum]|uniref:Uncharacterized protein n=1 Tax=Trichoderma harzianum TaxID=5544 RepID=A0A2K0U1Y0_TRIHA|nr:hypothetical protein THARTR1_07558 [Trichoderma harzianum]